MKLKNKTQISMLLISALLLSACGGGDDAPVKQTEIVGNVDNGRIYYLDNCSQCHAAGGDDNTTALGATSLVGAESRIKSNMAEFGGTYLLMSNFVDIPEQRIADLKAFLARQQ